MGLRAERRPAFLNPAGHFNPDVTLRRTRAGLETPAYGLAEVPVRSPGSPLVAVAHGVAWEAVLACRAVLLVASTQ